MSTSLGRQLALRLGLGGLLIAALLGGGTFVWEMERLDDVFVETAADEARRLAPTLPPRLEPSESGRLSEILRRFLRDRAAGADHFAGAEIYGLDQHSLAEAWIRDDGILARAVDRSSHMFPKEGAVWYAKHLVQGELYLLVVTGLATPDGRPLGYFEGVYHVSKERVASAGDKGLRTSILVIVSVLITSALLHPVISRLNRSLIQRSRDLLYANLGAIEMLGNAVAMRDSDTNSHNYRVTLYAVALAEAAGMTAAEIRSLLKGAFLHDVGKLAIPDAILLKPGKLDDKEFTVMKTHVEQGVELVERFEWLRDAAAVVGCHHEKFDGGGYPAGRAGRDIPLAARVFAIADVFDALTSRRPYKEPFPVSQTTAIMAAGRGSHFDPDLLDLFFTLAGPLHAEFGGRENEGLRETLGLRTLHYFELALER